MPRYEVNESDSAAWDNYPVRINGVRFTEIDVTVTPGARQEMMDRAGGQRKVPQIFVDGRHLGGCEELFDLESRGALDSLLGAPPEPEGAP